MDNSQKRSLLRWTTPLVALVVLVLLAWWGTYYWRPMFSNVFGRHEFDVIPRWQYRFADFVDRAGNFVLVDTRLNVVLVVIVPGQQEGPDINAGFQKSLPIMKAIRHSASRGGVSFKVNQDQPEVVIRRCSNQLIVVTPAGKILRASFRHPQAERMNMAVPEVGPRHEHNVLRVVQKYFSNEEPEVLDLLARAEGLRQKAASAPDSGA